MKGAGFFFMVASVCLFIAAIAILLGGNNNVLPTIHVNRPSDGVVTVTIALNLKPAIIYCRPDGSNPLRVLDVPCLKNEPTGKP